jgi:LysM repeat protein
MYRLFYYLRILLILLVIGALVGVIYYAIQRDNRNRNIELYNRQVTAAVETAVANAMYGATRTVEAPLRQYRLLTVTAGETLESVAERYRTSVEVIREVNALTVEVETGDGSQLIIPEGVIELNPPRRLRAYTARDGDTLDSLAVENNVPLDVLQTDNPILNERGISPGDVVFIAVLI